MRLYTLYLVIITSSLIHQATPSILQGGFVETLQKANGVLQDILDMTFTSKCSIIIITDQTTSSHTVKQVLMGRGTGIGVLEVTEANLTQAFITVLPNARKLRLSWWCSMVVVVSDRIEFLDTLARTADKTRLLVWDTKLLIITRLQKQHLYKILASHWVYSKMNTMAIAKEEETERWSVLSHMPYTPAGSEVIQLATWKPKHGLMHTSHLNLFPDKYTNFYGARENMSLYSFPPYWMPLGDDRNSSDKDANDSSSDKDANVSSDKDAKDSSGTTYTGRSYMILNTIAKTLNFSFDLLMTDDVKVEEHRIETRVALLSPMKLAVMPHKLQRFDFSFFIEPATLGFAMAKPQLRPQWQSLYQPLEGDVWLSIAIFLVIVPATLIIIIHVRPPSLQNNSTENISQTHIPTHLKSPKSKKTPKSSEVIQEMLGTLLGQNLSKRLLSHGSTRVMVGSWLLFAFILATVYRTSLFASLTVPKYPPRPESLDQLVQTDASVLMPPDIQVGFYPYFKASNSSTAKKLVQVIRKVPSHTAGLQLALKGKAAYVYESLFLRLLIGREYSEAGGWSPLYVAREYIIPGYSAWLMQRDAPYKHVFDKCILAFHGAGLIRRWGEVVLNEARLRETLQKRGKEKGKLERESGQLETQSGGIRPLSLTLTHLQGPIFLLAIGLVCSFISFTIELLSVRC